MVFLGVSASTLQFVSFQSVSLVNGFYPLEVAPHPVLKKYKFLNLKGLEAMPGMVVDSAK